MDLVLRPNDFWFRVKLPIWRRFHYMREAKRTGVPIATLLLETMGDDASIFRAWIAHGADVTLTETHVTIHYSLRKRV